MSSFGSSCYLVLRFGQNQVCICAIRLLLSRYFMIPFAARSLGLLFPSLGRSKCGPQLISLHLHWFSSCLTWWTTSIMYAMGAKYPVRPCERFCVRWICHRDRKPCVCRHIKGGRTFLETGNTVSISIANRIRISGLLFLRDKSQLWHVSCRNTPFV